MQAMPRIGGIKSTHAAQQPINITITITMISEIYEQTAMPDSEHCWNRSSHGSDGTATALPHVACAHLCLPPGVDDGAPPLAHHLGSQFIFCHSNSGLDGAIPSLPGYNIDQAAITMLQLDSGVACAVRGSSAFQGQGRHLEQPLPCAGVDGLPDAAQDAQRRAVVLLDPAVALAHKRRTFSIGARMPCI